MLKVKCAACFRTALNYVVLNSKLTASEPHNNSTLWSSLSYLNKLPKE